MRATLVVLVAACLGIASLPLAFEPAQARPGALATASLHERTGDGWRWMEWQGTSTFQVTGICSALLSGCLGNEEAEDGRFFLPELGSTGTVVVWWTAVNDSMRVLEVEVAGITLQGESPLTFQYPTLLPGEYAVHASPAGASVGAYKQPIEWSATFHVSSAPMHLQRFGSAGYSTVAGCALALCDVTLEQDSSQLIAPWDARGTLVVTWDQARLGDLAFALPGTGITAAGSSPLRIDLGYLPAGEWHLEVRPGTAAIPMTRGDVTWVADLTMA